MVRATVRKMLPIAPTLALFACLGENPPATEVVQHPAPSFSAEDRLIARKLSVGAGSLAAASAEGRNLLCVLGLDSIASQLSSSGALSEEQRQAFAQAREIYRRRAAAGYADGAKLAEAKRAAEADFPGVGDRARLAIACLRDMT